MDRPHTWETTEFCKLLTSADNIRTLKRLDLRMVFSLSPSFKDRDVNNSIIPFHLSRKRHLTHLQLQIVHDTRHPPSQGKIGGFVNYGVAIRSPHIQHLQLGTRSSDVTKAPYHDVQLMFWSDIPALLTLQLGTFWSSPKSCRPLTNICGKHYLSLLGCVRLREVSLEYKSIIQPFHWQAALCLRILQECMPSVEKFIYRVLPMPLSLFPDIASAMP